ncbi:hypothetical protein Cgig2_018420 [Carnegiea gigantea]|uniref:Transmembrane protein n=1 Tax=Carnegiea gigantea TaxID=171969 RepID=A0A9Q1Q6U4_9CARY|nr:hypothetical protein Cgig2_018420 [Carnegiea gigantea]
MVRLEGEGYLLRTNLLISVDESFAPVENSLPRKNHRLSCILILRLFPRATDLHLRRGERKRDLGEPCLRSQVLVRFEFPHSSVQFVYILLQVPFRSLSRLSDDASSSKNDSRVNTPKSHSGGTGTKVAIICLAIGAVVLSSFFLFKLRQKKKREEQYARLLKLFEEDDELEVELGLKD